MTDKMYNWKRFLCPRDEYDNLSLGYRGYGFYLPDPEGEYEQYANPQVTSLDKITNIPCLVILGEPGIGKTTVLSTEQQRVHELGEKCIYLDLRDCPSYNYLQDEIFKSDEFNQWQNGEHNLFIFLDSLDEGLVTINQFSGFISRELCKYVDESNRDRLFLRITCRSAHWCTSLENKLENVWYEKQKAYTLLPLREKDIIEAAESNQIVSDDFIQEIMTKNLELLTSIPITLNFLIDTYKKLKTLPSNRIDLYLEGCQILCEEVDKRTSREMKLAPEERVVVAARIAAATVLSGNNGIWFGADNMNVPEGDITIKELVGGYENLNGQIKIDRSTIKEAIATGLFISTNKRGADLCFHFRHKSYAEFLAAWYLKTKKVDLNIFIDLFIVHCFEEQFMPPHLEETAVWLAGMDQRVFDWLLENRKEILSPEDSVFDSIKEPSRYLHCLLKLFTNQDYDFGIDDDRLDKYCDSIIEHCKKFDRKELEKELKFLYHSSEINQVFASMILNILDFKGDHINPQDEALMAGHEEFINSEGYKRSQSEEFIMAWSMWTAHDFKEHSRNTVNLYINEYRARLKENSNIKSVIDSKKNALLKLVKLANFKPHKDDFEKAVESIKPLSEKQFTDFIIWLYEKYGSYYDYNDDLMTIKEKKHIFPWRSSLVDFLCCWGTVGTVIASKKISKLAHDNSIFESALCSWFYSNYQFPSPKEVLESILHPKKVEVVLCLQEIPENRKHKSYYVEIVVNPGKGELEKTYYLGKRMLPFFYTMLKELNKGRNCVDKEALKEALDHNSRDRYWFTKKIGDIIDWLEDRELSSYFKFIGQPKKVFTVESMLDKDQIKIQDLFDYSKAKENTK